MIENVSVHVVGYAREKEVLLLESLSVPGGTEGVNDQHQTELGDSLLFEHLAC
jgi:hypothetical protein